MSVLMKIRKGTKAQLTAYGHLEAGELGFTTDENLVYVGDGTDALRLKADEDYVIGSEDWAVAIEAWKSAKAQIRLELPYTE